MSNLERIGFAPPPADPKPLTLSSISFFCCCFSWRAWRGGAAQSGGGGQGAGVSRPRRPEEAGGVRESPHGEQTLRPDAVGDHWCAWLGSDPGRNTVFARGHLGGLRSSFRGIDRKRYPFPAVQVHSVSGLLSHQLFLLLLLWPQRGSRLGFSRPFRREKMYMKCNNNPPFAPVAVRWRLVGDSRVFSCCANFCKYAADPACFDTRPSLMLLLSSSLLLLSVLVVLYFFYVGVDVLSGGRVSKDRSLTTPVQSRCRTGYLSLVDIFERACVCVRVVAVFFPFTITRCCRQK